MVIITLDWVNLIGSTLDFAGSSDERLQTSVQVEHREVHERMVKSLCLDENGVLRGYEVERETGEMFVPQSKEL